MLKITFLHFVKMLTSLLFPYFRYVSKTREYAQTCVSIITDLFLSKFVLLKMTPYAKKHLK